MKKYRVLWLFGGGFGIGAGFSALFHAWAGSISVANAIGQIIAGGVLIFLYFQIPYLPEAKVAKKRKPAKAKK